MLKRVGVIFDQFISISAWLAGLLLVFGWLSVCADVFMRYFLNSPLRWVLEGTEHMLVFITFLSTAWVLRREAHVKIDVLLNLLRPRNQALVTVVTSILCAIFCLLVVWYGGQVIWDYFPRNVRLEDTVLMLPRAPLLSIVVVGSFFLFIQFLRRTYEHWRKWRLLASKE